MGSILIVDDDSALRRALRDRLSFWGHQAFEAAHGVAALELAENREFDLVLLDLAMPGRSGQEVLEDLKRRGCEADIIMLTAHGTIDSAVQALKAGAADFLLKTGDLDLLRTVVDRTLEQRQLRRVNLALSDRGLSGDFVQGASPAMARLLDTAARSARSNATVLLTGESGAGKQVIAEFIHRESERARGPFVYVNCVALSDELIESTLFGHEKGAFTGAVTRKDGRLEAAAGGTAFLDEVGDITPRLQTKLLHFLETNEFERVGGTRTISVDCRIIAATNRDLETSVREGRFREDLYFRLNVIHLRVPPLRERREDILPLARVFVSRFAAELGRSGLTLDPGAETVLREYGWPGNVRQLRNVIERMVVLAPTASLTSDLLPPELFAIGASAPEFALGGAGGEGPAGGVRPNGGGAHAGGTRSSAVRPLREALLEFKRDYIRQTLARTGGNQTRAAELLGLQRTFLNRLIKEYEL